MATCAPVTLTAPELTCLMNPQAWATALIADAQAQFNAIVNCIRNAPVTWCDICTMKAALLTCPLTCDMVNFEHLQYGDTAGVCQIPWPGTYETRYGVGVSDRRLGPEAEDYLTVEVTFDRPFDTECVHVSVTCVNEYVNKMELLHPIITEKSATGFTVYWEREDTGSEEYVNFTYVAFGL
jgi:hypothetical protein